MTAMDVTRAASTAAAITTPEAFSARLTEWQQQFNVLTPFTTFSALAPGWAISGTIVQLSPDKAVGDVYDGLPFLKPTERAIAKKGLRKLAEGAGISTQTYELATTDRYHWKVKAVASYRGIDGTTLTREATKEWDLRDGSPQMRGWKPDQIQEGRKHGLRNCEARAINAAIRECGCGIDQKYSVEQLRKPFIAIRVSFQPDMQDPEIKRMVTQSALGATAALYSGAAQPVARRIPDDEGDAPGRVIDVTAAAASTPGAVPSATTSTGAAAPNPDEPPTPDAVRIADAKPVPGTSKKTGRPYTKYEITDSRGETHSAFDKGVYEAAVTARDSQAWVEIAIEVANGFKNLVEISPAGQSPRLPMDGGY